MKNEMSHPFDEETPKIEKLSISEVVETPEEPIASLFPDEYSEAPYFNRSSGGKYGFDVHWAGSWENINGTWVPFYPWAKDLPTNLSGISTVKQRLRNLGKDPRDAMVKRVEKYKKEMADIKDEYQRDVRALMSRYPGDDGTKKRNLALRYAMRVADSRYRKEYNDFAKNMEGIQLMLLQNAMENEGKGYVLAFDFRNLDVLF